ncbi:MAG TPA: DUF3048 domain-containing protein [Candidatus Eisenbergiella intestinipullorum]|nr:DUF3048 domain-containing protein [Candidatus Eisenbergiella intestinipullorum]
MKRREKNETALCPVKKDRCLRAGRRFVAGLCAAFLAAALPAAGVRAQELPAGYVRSVYTNEPVSAAQAGLRPIAVMMPTDRAAQPSYGIGHAKVLYEIMEEGNISRQLAIIDDWQSLSRIGNIRSCRAYYLPIATEWDPILIHFGGVWYMRDRISLPDINNLSGTYEYGTGGSAPGADKFFRSSDRKAPHNAYISAEGITEACAQLGYSLTIRPEYYSPRHFHFAEVENTLEQYGAAAAPAGTIDLSDIFPYTRTGFTYNPSTGLYDKTIHGGAHKDADGTQLSFANVIVQNASWVTLDDSGYLAFASYDTTQDGWYFTRGRGIHITWQKTADYSPTQYFDDAGNEIQLNQGKTYIAVAQAGRLPAFS